MMDWAHLQTVIVWVTVGLLILKGTAELGSQDKEDHVDGYILLVWGLVVALVFGIAPIIRGG